MKSEFDFISATNWIAILIIAFGLIGGSYSGFAPWFFFGFFCFIGLLRWAINRSDHNKEKK